MNGYELLEEIRSRDDRFADLPFLFLSALSDDSHVLEGLNEGADDYLTKPVNFDLLLAKVDAQLRLAERMNARREREHVKLYRHLTGGDTPVPAGEPVPPPAPDAAPLPEPAPQNASATPAAVEIDEQATELVEQGVPVEASHVFFIGLDGIKERFGDEWPKRRDKVLAITEGVLAREVKGRSFWRKRPDLSYMLYFPKLPEDAAAARTEEVKTEILKHLLGQEDDAYGDLSLLSNRVDVNTGQAACHAEHSPTDEAIAIPAAAGNTASRSFIDEVNVVFRPLWSVAKDIVVGYTAVPQRPSPYGTMEGTKVLHGGDRDEFVPDLDMRVAAEVGRHLEKAAKTTERPIICLPVHYATVASSRREEWLGHVAGFPAASRGRGLFVEVIGVTEFVGGAKLVKLARSLSDHAATLGVRLDPADRHAAEFQENGFAFLSLSLEDVDEDAPPDLAAFSRAARKLGFKPALFDVTPKPLLRVAIDARIPFVSGAAVGETVRVPGKRYALRKEAVA